MFLNLAQVISNPDKPCVESVQIPSRPIPALLIMPISFLLLTCLSNLLCRECAGGCGPPPGRRPMETHSTAYHNAHMPLQRFARGRASRNQSALFNVDGGGRVAMCDAIRHNRCCVAAAAAVGIPGAWACACQIGLTALVWMALDAWCRIE